MGFRKISLLLGALLLAGGVLFFLLSPTSPPPSPLAESGGAGAAPAAPQPAPASPNPLGKKAERKRKALQGSPSIVAIPPGWKPHMGGIRGRIVDAGGSPAPGLDVEVYGDWLPSLLELAARVLPEEEKNATPSPGPLGRTRTDKKGRFLLQGLFPGEAGLLRVAEKETNLLTLFLPQVPAPGEVVDLGDIQLPDFASITGKVVDDETGEPLEGALVWATNLPGIAAASGLLDLRGGEWLLFSPGTGIPPRILRVPGAVRSLRKIMTFPSCRTGKDGIFRLGRVSPGRCSITVSKEGYLPLRRISLPARPGRRRDMGEIALRKGNEMRILVKDSTGAPVPGALVLAGAMPPLLPVAVMRPAGKTGRGGVLQARGIPDGRIYLAAAPPGEPWSLAGPFSPGEDGTVTLEKGADIPVVCVTKTGNVETPVEPETSVLTSFLDKRPLASHVKIQPGGRILLENLPKGAYFLKVSAKGYGSVTKVILSPLQDKKEEKLVFQKSCSLEVFVRDGAGRPVKQARVLPVLDMFLFTERLPFFRFRPVFTDNRGRAFLEDLRPGETAIAVQHPRAGNALKKVELPARAPLVVVLSPGRIEGWVIPPPGPEKDAPREIFLVGQDSPVPLKAARVTPKGTFLFPSVAPGKWEVILHKPFPAGPLESMTYQLGASGRGRLFQQSKSIQVGPGETKKVVFRLGKEKEKTGRIHGTLHVRGKSAAGFVVAAEALGESIPSAPTGPDGAYSVSGVPAGSVEILVLCQDPGFEGASRSLARKRVHLPPGGDLRVDFDLALGAVRGKVLGPGGRPLGGVMVEARRKKRRGPRAPYTRPVQAVTGTDGTFLLQNVIPGSWEVFVRSANFVSSENPVVEVTAPGRTPNVVLHAFPVISFLARPDPPAGEGEYYEGYKLIPAGGPMKKPLSGYAWGPGDGISLKAPAGDYVMEIWISGKKGRKWVARGRLTVPPKPSGPIPVLLGPREDPSKDLPKYPVSGKLLDEDGKPAGPGEIRFTRLPAGTMDPSTPFELEFSLPLAPGGTFRGNLPEGEYEWRASYMKGKKREEIYSDSRLTIPAGGARDLVLR